MLATCIIIRNCWFYFEIAMIKCRMQSSRFGVQDALATGVILADLTIFAGRPEEVWVLRLHLHILQVMQQRFVLLWSVA